ncbi:MAG: DNA polymerase III subunit gamma and tau [Cellulomonas sp.]|nr:DNA polymerase III subunit gamma and tau [Cellulomonas sp.]
MTTALYRRYRPETFAEVIGQDHVTAPLRHALRSGQVNHAYLFSGPRGCGKTSSARILARVLNCVQNTEEHPTDTPCGVCPSCLELATGGPGSLDVVEIDAASHGGVDDARELRERATFAPARDRFKVFILDEAHMVTPQGFNALLKIVEEPPPHVKFVFATTEPDKVIGTIRSRTHHYPFRLVPPDVLVPYLEQVCGREEVPVGAGVLSLVVRAGGGSVRDSLSVLDQLIAGSGPAGLEYEPAVALLGYTHASLLDDLVEALAARDGAAAFRVVERVISSGHEPRRFVEDLLERLRDLIVISAAGEHASAALRDVPTDQLERMRSQATHLGAFELSRSADLASVALTEMAGATSPRLQLELLMARLLLPAVDDSRTGLGARLDRLERGFDPGAAAAVIARPAEAPPARSTPTTGTGTSAAQEPAEAQVPATPVPASPVLATPGLATPETASPETASLGAASQGTSSLATSDPEVADPEVAAEAKAPAPAARPAGRAAAAAQTAPAPATAPAPGATRQALDTEMLRRRWPEVLEQARALRKATYALVQDNALPLSLDDTTLRLGFTLPGLASAFKGSQHAEVIARALRETLGLEVRVEAVLSGAETPTSTATPSSGTAMPTRAQAEASWDVTPQPGARPASAAPGAEGRSTPGSRRASASQGTAPQEAAPHGTPPRGSSPEGSAPHDASPRGSAAPGSQPQASPPSAAPQTTPGVGRPEPTAASPEQQGSDPAPPWDDVPPLDEPPWDDESGPAPAPTRAAAVRRPVATAPVRPAPQSPAPGRPAPAYPAPGRSEPVYPGPDLEDEPSPDDPEIAGSGLVGAPLVAQLLGGKVIDEQVEPFGSPVAPSP